MNISKKIFITFLLVFIFQTPTQGMKETIACICKATQTNDLTENAPNDWLNETIQLIDENRKLKAKNEELSDRLKQVGTLWEELRACLDLAFKPTQLTQSLGTSTKQGDL